MNGVSALGLAFGVALAAIAGAWIRLVATDLGPASWRQRPWITWGLNMVACFLMGLLASQGSHRTSPSPGTLELVAAVGFLGSLSTFSTLMADLVITWQRRARRQTLALGAASLLGGLLACQIGLVLARPQP
jgi:CrcB protein